MALNAIEPKRGADVGRVVVELTVENDEDLARAARGELPRNEIRRITTHALVDTGATFCCLPRQLVDQLGLRFLRSKEARTAAGPITLDIFGIAHISVQQRDCATEIMAIPDGRQALLGQIPLEMMDWWVDPVNQKLVGNPEHDGQWMAEVF